MKLPELEIYPLSVTICGHLVRIEITATTHIGVWSNPDIGTYMEKGSIEKALSRNEIGGTLEGDIYIPVGIPCEGTVVGFTAQWYRAFDYRQFHSLFRWWWNHSFAEALLEQDFKNEFGERMGEHYFEKWRLYERNIPKMIGYFGDDMHNGQTFLNLVAKKVVRCENSKNQKRLCVSN